tara:strand:+ start:85 stop:534 length:450 start_codon:yes stop_codon:yes gene_type:complete
MDKRKISQTKQKKILDLFRQGKSIRFISREVNSDTRTVKSYLSENNAQKKTLSPNAKKILSRQKKINFFVFEQLKNQVQKDQKYLSNLNDPLTGCGRYALAKAAKEANETSNYSKSLIQAINTAEQLIALFKGQQELLGFNENKVVDNC